MLVYFHGLFIVCLKINMQSLCILLVVLVLVLRTDAFFLQNRSAGRAPRASLHMSGIGVKAGSVVALVTPMKDDLR